MSQPTLKQIAKYAVDQMQSGKSTTVLSKKIAALLSTTRRSHQYSKLMSLIELESNRRGQTQIQIESAYAIDPKTASKLAKLLDAKTPVFSTSINSDLIGGVIARTIDKEIDLSVLSKLKLIRSGVNHG